MDVRRHSATVRQYVQLVLPPGWVPRINALAIEHGVTRSALIRAAIASVYLADSSDSDTIEKPLDVAAATSSGANSAPLSRSRQEEKE